MGLFNFNLTTAHYTRDKKTKEKLVFFLKQLFMMFIISYKTWLWIVDIDELHR